MMVAVFSAYREAPGEWERRMAWAREYGEPYAPVGAHTREEAELMVDECQRRGERELLLVTSDYHAKRAYLTTIKVLYEQHLERSVLLNVTEVVRPDEAEKVSAYQAMGHCATSDQERDYRQFWIRQCATS